MTKARGHETMGEVLECYSARTPLGWAERAASPQQMRTAREFMLRGLDEETIEKFSTGLVECLIEWKLASDLLEQSHHHLMAGGGMELEDHVRELLRSEKKLRRVEKLMEQRRGLDAALQRALTEEE